MARTEWVGRRRLKWCSYKRVTLIVCSFNIFIALYLLSFLYNSAFLYSSNASSNSSSRYNVYTPEEIKKMEESVEIRKEAKPLKLFKVVNDFVMESAKRKRRIQLPLHIKYMIKDNILQVLKGLDANANATDQREAVENWRMSIVSEAKRLINRQKNVTLTVSRGEAVILVEALESKWPFVMEEIGLYIPLVFVHSEHDDKPPGTDDDEDDPLPGRSVPPECNAELHTDYDGVAVKWGLTHHKETAADCCQACLDQAKRAKPGELKCNIWVYCPSEAGCFSPDIYQHKHQECWLKYAEKPKLNFKDKYSESYRNDHPTAPLVVPWVSGVVSKST